MTFKNRKEAGQLLAEVLKKRNFQNPLILGLPRGGVVLAAVIAKELAAPLDLLLAHKIGHPYHPEYAIAAVSEEGHIVHTSREPLDQRWLEEEKQRQMAELKRKRKLFLKGKKPLPIRDKVAIIVDDGIATGSTLKAGIMEIKAHHPKKLIVAVPVTPEDTAREIRGQVDELIALKVLSPAEFGGAVGVHYTDFSQVEDEDVIALMEEFL